MIRVIEHTGSHYKVHSREITQKASKGEQPFLHVTHRLDPIYMPTKYFQNISKGIKVIERTSFCLRMDRRQTGHYIPKPCQSGDKKREKKYKENIFVTYIKKYNPTCNTLLVISVFYLFKWVVLIAASLMSYVIVIPWLVRLYVKIIHER